MEEKRTDEFFPVFEDEQGSYILNSKDMCMIDHLDEVAKAGVTSFKIEGRAKSSYYVSIVTNAYRMAMDIFKADPDNYKIPDWLRDEVFKVSHRKYCAGFFYGHPKDTQFYENGGYIREYDVVAVVDECKDSKLYITQRNRFCKGDEVEIVPPGKKYDTMVINELYNYDGDVVENANHAMEKLIIPCEKEYPTNTVIRMKKK